MTHRLLPLVLVGLLVPLVVGRPARAYTVSTGFTDGCHEMMIAAAFQDFLLEMPLGPVEVPGGKAWRKVASHVLEEMGADEDQVDEPMRFMLVSLVVGVRSNDTDGHSIMNLTHLRQLHADPSAAGQYLHALRGPDDDREAGDAAAVAGTREMILALSETFYEYFQNAGGEQVISTELYFDFYGLVDVQVWAPFFYVGRAAHALQDTFSHTIRDEDDGYRTIVHVLNYIDAIGDDHDEDRDGLAHSDHMDLCRHPDMVGPTAAAIEATTDYFLAVRELAFGRDPEAVRHVLDKWVTLQPGCTRANDFCDNAARLKVARKDPTEPYLQAIFCGVAPTPRSTAVALAGLLGLLLVVRFRARGR